jgi:pimeloyl-ACP methyl ester carboxylesterase
MAERIAVQGPSGRVLDVHLDGAPDGAVVVSHTGTPSAGTLRADHEHEAIDRGLRRVSYARPGYARSERRAGRTVADCAEDVAAIADHLGVERFYVTGRSGGGPHALATAALLPDRVIATASIAGVAPWKAEGLDWLDGMGPENHEEMGAAAEGEEPLREYLEGLLPEFAAVDAASIRAALGELLSGVDRDALTGELAEHMASDFRASVEHGPWGWFDDDLAFVRNWGFDPGAISGPVAIWQGAEDRFVPLAHGEWLLAHIPNATARLMPEHGHLSLAESGYGEILDQLLAAG